MKTSKRLLVVGQPMPKETWGCAVYVSYPCELTQNKNYQVFPRMFVGWGQTFLTSIRLPDHAVMQLRRGT